jgi:uncharacterized protein YraI
MSRITTGFAAAAIGVFGLATAATAATQGYTAPEANLRAGPGRDYPLISQIPPNQPTYIHGCLGGWGWCDVSVDGMRGWIAGRKLRVFYDNRRIDLPNYAPRFGLPIIQFDIGTYWGQYYRGRPFYAEGNRWAGPGGFHPEGRPGDHYDHGEHYDRNDNNGHFGHPQPGPPGHPMPQDRGGHAGPTAGEPGHGPGPDHAGPDHGHGAPSPQDQRDHDHAHDHSHDHDNAPPPPQ